MATLNRGLSPSSSDVLEGALIHLGSYLEHQCHRSATLAILLFERVAADENVNANLQLQAMQWVDTLNDAISHGRPVQGVGASSPTRNGRSLEVGL